MSNFDFDAGVNILREKGAKSLTQDAAGELSDFVESVAEEIAEEAISTAKSEDRTTVKKRDVRDAIS